MMMLHYAQSPEIEETNILLQKHVEPNQQNGYMLSTHSRSFSRFFSTTIHHNVFFLHVYGENWFQLKRGLANGHGDSSLEPSIAIERIFLQKVCHLLVHFWYPPFCREWKVNENNKDTRGLHYLTQGEGLKKQAGGTTPQQRSQDYTV